MKAGFTYCAISSLANLNRLPNSPGRPPGQVSGITDLNLTLHWLCSRQIASTDDDDPFDAIAGELDRHSSDDNDTPTAAPTVSVPIVHSTNPPPTPDPAAAWTAGFNGRSNKLPDTCYAWWVCASLVTLGQLDLVDAPAGRRYLLGRTQHVVGGFGKGAGDPPDVYHSYLGLATLAVAGEEGLKDCDSVLTFSKDVRGHAAALLRERGLPVTDI